MTTAILFGSFFLLLLIGVPIGIALGAASLLAIAYIPFLNFDMYALGLVSGIDSFTLIAVVLFTLAGSLMAQGGISRRLIAVADRAFGRAPPASYRRLHHAHVRKNASRLVAAARHAVRAPVLVRCVRQIVVLALSRRRVLG